MKKRATAGSGAADRALAKRWKDRIRFVLDDRGRFVPQWRNPSLVRASIRKRFEARVRRTGPSLAAIRELEALILKSVGQLRPPEAKLIAILDAAGFAVLARPK
jgi:hypothetical protein